jgi:alpha-D-ribose 1-methylphosphonate 5-triphosphate diphosphatase PhnM
MAAHDELKKQFEIYLAENEKFTEKGVKLSATRARNALSEIAKLCKERRIEILQEKDAKAE